MGTEEYPTSTFSEGLMSSGPPTSGLQDVGPHWQVSECGPHLGSAHDERGGVYSHVMRRMSDFRGRDVPGALNLVRHGCG
eukprot:357920-Lingulodinium_polyedra.AAC.1